MNTAGLNAKEKSRLMLSWQTVHGWRMTGNIFSIDTNLQAKCGTKYFYQLWYTLFVQKKRDFLEYQKVDSKENQYFLEFFKQLISKVKYDSLHIGTF